MREGEKIIELPEPRRRTHYSCGSIAIFLRQVSVIGNTFGLRRLESLVGRNGAGLLAGEFGLRSRFGNDIFRAGFGLSRTGFLVTCIL